MIVHDEKDQLNLLIANFIGVEMLPIGHGSNKGIEKLLSEKCEEVAVRKLDYVKSQKLKHKLLSFAREMEAKPFQNSFKNLLSMVVNPPEKLEKERLVMLIRDAKNQHHELKEALLIA